MGREISRSEMRDIVDRSKDLKLVFSVDNVQNQPSFICHCCGCCCGILDGINKHGYPAAIVSSTLVPKVGIDAAVSPRMSAVNAILRYVRRGRVMTVAALKGIDAEAIEFNVGPNCAVLGRPIRELNIPKGAVIGTILRGDEVILPRGDDEIELGDEVIVFTLPGSVGEVEKLFAE